MASFPLWLMGLGGTLFGLVLWLKWRRESKIRYAVTSNVEVEGTIVIITGANCGLGRELALELANRKALVILACRDLTKATEAIKYIQKELQLTDKESVNLVPMELNLSSLQSVESFVLNFRRNYEKLDILVNNAGQMGTPFALSEDGIEMQFAVNHLGHFYLTNLLLDVLQKSAPSRIVTLTSGYYKKAKTLELDKNLRSQSPEFDPLKAYARSKLANCLHSIRLAYLLKDSKVFCYAVRPGFVRGTELGKHFSALFKTLATPLIWFVSKDLQQGVQTILHCCLEKSEKLKSGALYDNCEVQKYSNNVTDKAAETLWTLSESLVEEIKSQGQ